MCYAPLFAKISNENGIAKALANSKPICGVRYMPRRWRNFAKQKARRRLFSRRMPGGPGGNVRVSFLATSWEMPRSSMALSAPRCGAPVRLRNQPRKLADSQHARPATQSAKKQTTHPTHSAWDGWFSILLTAPKADAYRLPA